MNREERRAIRRQARANIPSDAKSMIARMAARAKGRPWIVAYWAAADLTEMVEHLPFANKGNLTEAQLSAILAEMVTLLLEGMSPLPERCDGPFQAVVYQTSSRSDLNRRAQRYIDNIGGPEVARVGISEWITEHRELVETLPRDLLVYIAVAPGDGPLGTLDDLLDRWTQIGRENFEARGHVEPLSVGILPDGRQLHATMRPFRNVAEKKAGRAKADEELRKGRAVQTIEIFEAWMASGELKFEPHKAEDRREVVFVSVSDGDRKLSSYSAIERDWQTGKPTLKKPKKGELNDLGIFVASDG